MENEKMMDKQGMTAEREKEILKRVIAERGKEQCLRVAQRKAESLSGWCHVVAMVTEEPIPIEFRREIQQRAAMMSVWLNALSLILGEPVEEEIDYLEELAEEVGLDGE